MIFTGFEDRVLMLSGVVLDVSPPSVCGAAAETEITQRRGGRRRTTAFTALESDSVSPTVVEEFRKDHS